MNKSINLSDWLRWFFLAAWLLLGQSAFAQLAVTTTTLPSGVLGLGYNQTLQASGASGPLTWQLTAGTLPGGLSLNTATGVISGTPNTPGTGFNFNVRVSDGANTSPAQSLSITINPGPVITTTLLPNGSLNTSYSQQLQAAGGIGTKTWDVSAGSLPNGLTLSSNGLISGTPSSAGTFSFTARVTDVALVQATQALSITIIGGPTITTTSLPNAQLGAAYSQQLLVSGGALPLTWAISAGALPSGLTLSSGGLISGTPTTQGTFNFNVRATDQNGAQVSATLSILVTLVGGPAITTATLPNAFVTVPYAQQLQASGGAAPLTWAISAGALPPGLTFNTTGLISGTPSAGGTFNFTVRVTDNNGAQATRALTIIVSTGPVITTTSPLPEAEVGRFYTQQLRAGGGTAPITWTIPPGALPAGLNLSGSTGTITGVPTTPGTANFTVTATDASGAKANKDLSISVIPPAPGTLQFGAATFTVAENAGNAVITVERKGGSSGSVTVALTTGRGSATPSVDYAFSLQIITFIDGENTPKNIELQIADDAFSEGSETVELNLSNPGGGAVIGAQSSAVLTILDDETGSAGGGGGGGGGGGCATDAAAREVSLLALLVAVLVARRRRRFF